MSSAPVLVLDIDGVVSLAQPGSATPWYATLKQDLGLDYEEIERDFFRGGFMSVLQGRLDLYVALHNYLEPRGLADRMEEFVAYWFEKDAVIDRAANVDGARMCGWRAMLYRGPESLSQALARWG